MDRTHPCGGCNVGSIPAGSTRGELSEARYMCSRALCRRTVRAGIERVKPIARRPWPSTMRNPHCSRRERFLISLCYIFCSSSRRSTDRMAPSEGADASSILAESTKLQKKKIPYSGIFFLLYLSALRSLAALALRRAAVFFLITPRLRALSIAL